MPFVTTKPETRLEPVGAYSRIASGFSAVSNRRRAYLDAIDRLVIEEIPRGARSLLDIGHKPSLVSAAEWDS